jgi:hypothetical protein
VTKYLLPCPCGQNTVVEPRQAGETIFCACGASLSVPTVRQMAKLELAEEVDPSSSQTWGSRERMLLIGGGLFGIGLVLGLWLAFHQPVTRFDFIGPDRIRQNAASMSLSKSWDAWTSLKRGINPAPDPVYESWVRDFCIELAVAIVLIGVGGGLLFSGWRRKKGLLASS